MTVSRWHRWRLRRSARAALLLSVLPLAALSGCAMSDLTLPADPSLTPATPASSLKETVGRITQARVVAKTYDAAVLAARRDDANRFKQACDILRGQRMTLYAVSLARQHEVGPAERSLQSALDFQMETENPQKPPSGLEGLIARVFGSSDPIDTIPRSQWEAHTEQLYRQVLAQAPNFDSDDPQKLNALGYYLADRGRTMADFQQAERLTRNALQLWDEILSQTSLDDARRPGFEYIQAQGPRDSLAWALFRQRRYTEALIQQERAVSDESRVARSAHLPMTADLHYHLGQIEHALKLNDRARRQYREALTLDPNHAASRDALKTLAGSPP